MCEILVVKTSRSSNDPNVDCLLFKRGDVITVQKDGHPWGVSELNNPEWMLLKLPLVPLNYGNSFLGQEYPIEGEEENKSLRRRQFYIDLDKLPENVEDTTKEYLMSIKIEKIRMDNPEIL